VSGVGEPGREALALAIGHEVGNLLAAIRLTAHLLDESATPRALAVATVEIEDLAERAGSLLVLLRTALGTPASGTRADPTGCLAELRARADGWARGVRLSVEAPGDLPLVAADAEALQHLLATWLAGALEEARPRGRVRLAAHAEAGSVVFEVEDDGSPAEDPAGWARAALRGRPLGFALGGRLAEAAGGEVQAERAAGSTRLRLRLPALAATR
jgi:signal transduction histidine kinase